MTYADAEQPSEVRIAALLFFLYGLLVLANALSVGLSAGMTVADAALPRPAVRALGTGLVALGLWRGARWAWWLAVLLGGLWFVAGVVGLAAVFATGSAGALPSRMWWFAPVALSLLGGALGLLFLPTSREAFRARPA